MNKLLSKKQTNLDTSSVRPIAKFSSAAEIDNSSSVRNFVNKVKTITNTNKIKKGK